MTPTHRLWCHLSPDGREAIALGIAGFGSTLIGRQIGGGWFSRGLLHVMLRRVTYDGQIAHCDSVYVGNDLAILEPRPFRPNAAAMRPNCGRSRLASQFLKPAVYLAWAEGRLSVASQR